MKKNLLYVGNALSRKGATVTSIETLGTFLSQEGYGVITTSSKKNKVLRLLDMLVTVYTHRKKVDYILLDTYSTTNYWYAVSVGFLARIFRIPYIPILRGGDLPNRLQKSKKSAHRLFKNAHINIAPSDYLMKAFKKAGFSNLTHIPNTIQLENYNYEHRKKAEPTLLWVRSFSKIYNPILALKALKELLGQYPKMSLTMVGPEKDGSMEECFAFAKAHSLPVTFTGGLPKEQWLTLAATHDIFINTTNFDNTPVSVIEAMALGLPVVSTNVGGIPYLLKDKENALLVPPQKITLFAEAICKLLENNKLTADLSENARLKVESFDWNVVKTQWKAILS